MGFRGKEAQGIGARHAAIAPCGPFEAGDGKVVFLGLQNERKWARCREEVLGR